MGYIHIYTGEGKGKTTAALGLCLRAVCAGKRIFFAQFLKNNPTSELAAMSYLPNFTIRQYGSGKFIDIQPTQDDFNNFNIGFAELNKIIFSGNVDLIVIDEICACLNYKLLEFKQLSSICQYVKNNEIDIVFTGRNAQPDLIEIADLVTEMKKVKHYFDKGVKSRKGIEK